MSRCSRMVGACLIWFCSRNGLGEDVGLGCREVAEASLDIDAAAGEVGGVGGVEDKRRVRLVARR